VRSMPMPKRIGLFIFSFCLFTFYLTCAKDFSPVKIINPPDTTSHNFTWRLDTLGTNWSILLDVAIINENDIWAVGAIQPDPTGLSDIYNAIHWDGQQWRLKRIPYIYNGQPFYNSMNFTFSFTNEEVWFGGNGIVKWNGNNFSNVEVDQNAWGPVAINKMWGSSPNNVFIVGNEGSIAHYNGSSWQKIESGTTVDIQDIWGAMNPQSGEWEIMAVASFGIGVPQAKQLLRIDGTTVSTVQDSGLPLALETIWFVPGEEYFVGGGGGGAGIYHTNDITQGWKADTRQAVFYMFSIRGLGLNDMLMAGGHGYLSHYNGSTSRLYTGAELQGFFGNYYSVAAHPKFVVAVGGYEGRKGVVAVGKR
jgi:hypothetical protein